MSVEASPVLDDIEPAPATPVAASEHFARNVMVVAGVALVLRLVLQRFEPPPPRNADEIWYVRMARNLVDGRGFIQPTRIVKHGVGHIVWVQTAVHAPLSALLLVPATFLERHGYVLQRATMALVGAGTVVAIAYAAKELAGARVGLIAAVVAAVYGGLWVNDLVATSEAPAALLLSVTLLLALEQRRRPTSWRLVVLGLTLGLLALDRAELALLGVVLVVPTLVAVARRSKSTAATLVRSGLVVAVLAVGIVVPWSAYNETRFHQTVVISNNLGRTLLGANCDESYYGPLTGYDGRFCFLPALRSTPKGLNEAGADAYYRHIAVTYALNHWHRWPIVGAMRELWLWSLWSPGWTVFMSGVFIGRPAWIAWTQIVSFWLLAPLAIYGAVLARRRKVRLVELATMVCFTAALGLVVVGHLRYRLPAELACVILGAIAVDRLVFGRDDSDRLASSSLRGGDDLRRLVPDREDATEQEGG